MELNFQDFRVVNLQKVWNDFSGELLTDDAMRQPDMFMQKIPEISRVYWVSRSSLEKNVDLSIQ